MTTSYDSELSYLNRDAADYEDSLTDEEQDEVDEKAMKANIAAWDGASFQANYDAYCEQQAEFEELGLKYLVMADLDGTEEPF